MTTYSTVVLARYFGRTETTVRNWADEFHQHLSPTATSTTGRNRVYSEDDASVLSLVHTLKNNGGTFSDIHAALANGARGDMPEIPPEELKAMITAQENRELTTRVEQLEGLLIQAEERLQMLRQVQDENVELKTKIAIFQEELNRERDNAPDVTGLYRQIGKLEAQIEYLKEALDK